ncbi:uncharacterized protein Z520_11754 [Fonsecaea multimorphosa CBS 102226]|uniref:F-box domain-containing protein n=1 Tax=Fonsecaea multimorphosa CBS 102226 TaxID=1442371 RepID=A0A0D2K8C5_9EURO|nr:uncharacterized protein Z520_11754 [Fonsecaea multimorphosa CBS 102226]KIX92578.1 hypothetical protein Z520_11754 [Fonsecaea multimorphosa CBS 102226]OAL17840.1 hypothetical protein AYO22_11267 [Fonsecaea multimorphosa]
MRATTNSESLPEEVLLEIVKLVATESQQTMRNLSLCNRQLHRLTTPELYRNVRLAEMPDIGLFFRSLCYQHDLARYIHSVSITAYDYPILPYREDFHVGSELIESCSPLLFSDTSARFSEFLALTDAELTAALLSHDDEGLWLAFLALQLPCLREIKLVVNAPVLYLGDLFEFAVTNGTDLNLFRSLSTIEMSVGDEVELLPFLRLPSLRTFKVARIVGGGAMDMSLVSQLRSLDLRWAFEDVGDILALLGACRHLQTLRILRRFGDDEGAEYAILGLLANSCSDSLEELDLLSWNVSTRPRRVEMARFVNLTRLKIPSTMILTPPAGDTRSSDTHSGNGLLPLPKVRELTLYLMNKSGPLEHVWSAVLSFITNEMLAPMLTTLSLEWLNNQIDMEQERAALRALAVAARRRGLQLRLEAKSTLSFFPGRDYLVLDDDAEDEQSGIFQIRME